MEEHLNTAPAIAFDLYTIGHSTRPIDEFLALLKAHGIKQLVDVRTAAGSRRNPQFMKDELSRTLAVHGIRYTHVPALGGFRKPRADSPNAAWRNASFRGYADHMQTPEFEWALAELLELAARAPTAVMCAESVPWRCHRSLIADAVVARGFTAGHIASPHRCNAHILTSFARVENGRVMYPEKAEMRVTDPNNFTGWNVEGGVMEEHQKSQLQDELKSLFGPRRFLSAGNDGEGLGMASPQTVAEVQQLARLTRDAKVPIIPRAGMSSPFARASEGLVVSFDFLSKIGGINTRSSLVTVEPGVIWHTLIEHLASRGLMLRVYPSSEGFSTVGGFVAQGGVGIGSYQFGDIGRNVARLHLVDANGELHRIKGEELRLVVGAEGRTGLVVQVTLRLQELATMRPLVAVFDSFEDVERCLSDVVRQALPIWSINLMGRIGAGVQSRSWPDMALPEGSHAVIFSFRQRDADVIVPALQAGILAARGRVFEVLGTNEDWLVQFASLQAQTTTPIPMQFQVPLGRAAKFDGGIRSALRRKLAVEAVLTDAGKMVVLRLFFADLGASPEDNLGAARELLALAKSLGGASYTTGAMYLQEAETVFGTGRLKDIAAFRRIVDPDNRLNPGNAFS